MICWVGLMLLKIHSKPADLRVTNASLREIPRVTGLPTPHPTAISADGRTIIGQFSPGKPFIIRGGSLSKFAPVAEALDPYAQAVSADGTTIVGRAESAYRWRRELIQTLAKVKGFEDTYACGVSGDGNTVVGYRQVGSTTQGLIWRPGHAPLSIVPSADSTSCVLNAASFDGVKVVGFTVANRKLSPLLVIAGKPRILPLPTGWSEGQATGISKDGSRIIGQLTSDQRTQAVIWANGLPRALTSPTKSNCSATCLSSDGSVIGGDTLNPDQSLSACLWIKGRSYSLTSLLSKAKVNVTGWKLEQIHGIAKVGRRVTLVGWGFRITPNSSAASKPKEAGFIATFSLYP